MAIVLYTAEKYVGQVWTYAYHALPLKIYYAGITD